MDAVPWSDDGMWVRGVDYIAGWQDAHDAASQLNQAAARAGSAREVIRASAHTGPRGEGVVWLSPDAVRLLIELAWGAELPVSHGS